MTTKDLLPKFLLRKNSKYKYIWLIRGINNEPTRGFLLSINPLQNPPKALLSLLNIGKIRKWENDMSIWRGKKRITKAMMDERFEMVYINKEWPEEIMDSYLNSKFWIENNLVFVQLDTLWGTLKQS